MVLWVKNNLMSYASVTTITSKLWNKKWTLIIRITKRVRFRNIKRWNKTWRVEWDQVLIITIGCIVISRKNSNLSICNSLDQLRRDLSNWIIPWHNHIKRLVRALMMYQLVALRRPLFIIEKLKQQLSNHRERICYSMAMIFQGQVSIAKVQEGILHLDLVWWMEEQVPVEIGTLILEPLAQLKNVSHLSPKIKT